MRDYRVIDLGCPCFLLCIIFTFVYQQFYTGYDYLEGEIKKGKQTTGLGFCIRFWSVCSESFLPIPVFLVGGPVCEAIATGNFVYLLFLAANEKPGFEICFLSQ